MVIVIILSLVPLCVKNPSEGLLVVEQTTIIIFTMDYLLRWITYDHKKPYLKKKAFLFYPFYPFPIIDLLSILPIFAILFPALEVFYLFRLFRALKALKILRYSKSVSLVLRIFQKERQALLSVVYLAMGYILVSALIMFSVEPDNFDSFFEAVYWATTVLTTVGYGDIYPLTSIGKLVSILSSFVGVALVSLPAGIITAGYLGEIEKRK